MKQWGDYHRDDGLQRFAVPRAMILTLWTLWRRSILVKGPAKSTVKSTMTHEARLVTHQYILEVEEQLRASKEEMERCLAQYDELFQTIQRLSEELKVQIDGNASLQVRS